MKQGNSYRESQAYVSTGSGPVVILIHGLFGNLGMWKFVVAALKNNFQVVVPRLPLLELPADYTHVKYLTKALHKFIENNKLKNVTLVGHAIGGQIALMYTNEY